jgi:hypothetical protein
VWVGENFKIENVHLGYDIKSWPPPKVVVMAQKIGHNSVTEEHLASAQLKATTTVTLKNMPMNIFSCREIFPRPLESKRKLR